MASYLDPLADAAIGAASLSNNSKQQMNILDLTKTVIESALQFMYSSKEGGGNPKVRSFNFSSLRIVYWVWWNH